MAQNKSGLQKKVSSIFDGAPIPNAGGERQKNIVPLLSRNSGLKASQKEEGMDVNLIRFRKNGEQKAVKLPSAVTVVGRRSNCDLRIPLDSISKRHCQINCDDGALKIRDLGSHNGTFLNGVRINEALIQPGDWMQIGPIGFVFQINGQPEKVTAPAVKKEEKPKPKKQKTEPKAEKKSAEQAEDDQFASLDDKDMSSILNADLKEPSDDTDILIDDSDELKDDLNLDDLDELKNA